MKHFLYKPSTRCGPAVWSGPLSLAETIKSFLRTKHTAQLASVQRFSLPEIDKFTIMYRRRAFSGREVREDCHRRRLVRSFILHSFVPKSSYPPPSAAPIILSAWFLPLLQQGKALGAIAPTYRGTSLIRNSPPLEPYSRTEPRALLWS